MPSVYTEKDRAVKILECFLSGKLPDENKNGLCACGCGESLLTDFDRRYVNLTINHIDFSTIYGNNSYDNFSIMKRGHHVSYHKQIRKKSREIETGINAVFTSAETELLQSAEKIFSE